MFMKVNHLCDLVKLFGLIIQYIKSKVLVSLSKKTADGRPNIFLNLRIFSFFLDCGQTNDIIMDMSLVRLIRYTSHEGLT